MDFLGLVRLAGIVRCVGPLGIASDTSLIGELRIIVRPIPVGGPLPDVAGHVIKTVAISGIRRDWANADLAIRARIFVWKMSLMRVCHPLAVRTEIVAPDKWLSGETAARGKLPLRLGREALSCPLGVSKRIFISHMD